MFLLALHMFFPGNSPRDFLNPPRPPIVFLFYNSGIFVFHRHYLLTVQLLPLTLRLGVLMKIANVAFHDYLIYVY